MYMCMCMYLLKKYCNRRQVKFPMKDKEIKDIQEMKSIDAIIILMTQSYKMLSRPARLQATHLGLWQVQETQQREF